MQRLVVAQAQFVGTDRVTLTLRQRHYLLSVLRLRAGDRLIVLNGVGQGWVARLTAAETEEAVELVLLERHDFQTELPLAVNLVAALPKNGFDEVVRCCTELGVTKITPVMSARTVLKPSVNKLKRWQKIATEAAEQSERAIVPQIVEPQDFQVMLGGLVPENSFLCAARKQSSHLLTALPKLPATATEITVLIGPEGGWSDQEIKQAIAAKIIPVSLGRSILRAVTASITAVSFVNAYLNNDHL
ncbi:MAG: 16S rRNA (uracil(1498)-N(3))-methyltransferase [Limnothrix sp.]